VNDKYHRQWPVHVVYPSFTVFLCLFVNSAIVFVMRLCAIAYMFVFLSFVGDLFNLNCMIRIWNTIVDLDYVCVCFSSL